MVLLQGGRKEFLKLFPTCFAGFFTTLGYARLSLSTAGQSWPSLNEWRQEMEATQQGFRDVGLLSVKNAALYLDCSPWTIRHKVYRGELMGVKVGAKLCVEKVELDRYILEHWTNVGK